MRAWDPVVSRVGELIDEDRVTFGPDRVEPGAIRRYLEPIELDSAIHTDVEAARRHGWPGIVAPYTSVWSALLPAVWSPERGPLYPEGAGRDAQPAWSPIGDDVVPGAPATSAVFGADLSLEFDRPLLVGERAGAGPRRLVACTPKETRVGRGAFVRFERDVVVESGERVCRMSAEIYLYDPHPAKGADGD
ncbi:N-terminal half of MaoC dehydratase [Aeromicrobium choanae]|uniref:N-terminal half of MaoC dehydratase n=2 Tax=Aeromicrobium choanae TaxID=1736691 RepID=A0A1T4YXY6_9ACTN|nr:N-terminal half of MaoC dehydratase [Aeromicrobium choanae]